MSQKFRAYCGCRQTCRSRSLHRAITETLLLCSGCCVASNVHISLSSPCFLCLSLPPAIVVNLSRSSGLDIRHAGAATHRICIVTRFIVESITSARLLLLGCGRPDMQRRSELPRTWFRLSRSHAFCLHLRHAGAATHRIRIVTWFIVESITSARLLLLGRGRP